MTAARAASSVLYSLKSSCFISSVTLPTPGSNCPSTPNSGCSGVLSRNLACSAAILSAVVSGVTSANRLVTAGAPVIAIAICSGSLHSANSSGATTNVPPVVSSITVTLPSKVGCPV